MNFFIVYQSAIQDIKYVQLISDTPGTGLRELREIQY